MITLVGWLTVILVLGPLACAFAAGFMAGLIELIARPVVALRRCLASQAPSDKQPGKRG